MLEISLGGLTFSIMGCSVLLVAMLAERRHKMPTKPDIEPGFKWSVAAAIKVELEAFPIRHKIEVELPPTLPEQIAKDSEPVTYKAKPTKRKKTHGVQSPSKHMTLAQLEKIKADNYCGESHEYCAEEIDAAIVEKSQRRADHFVSEQVKRLTLANINF